MWCPETCQWSFEFPPISLSSCASWRQCSCFLANFTSVPEHLNLVFCPLFLLYRFWFVSISSFNWNWIYIVVSIRSSFFYFFGMLFNHEYFLFQSFDLIQFHPSMQFHYKSVIFLVSRFDFFQFYPSNQVNYGFQFHFDPSSLDFRVCFKNFNFNVLIYLSFVL